MIDKFNAKPTTREFIRDFNDLVLRFMFYCSKGNWEYLIREAKRYDFMWEWWVEAIYSYDSPPTPEYHRSLIEPDWFRDWKKRRP